MAAPISAKYGRWSAIILLNAFVIVGNGISFIDNFYVCVLGRFIYGVGGSAFTVFCPKYISETSPVAIKGTVGAMNSLGFTTGRLCVFIFGFIHAF
jgi:MFS family permease